MPLTQIDSKSAMPSEGEMLFFSLVKDEALRLPFLLNYYRSLGVDRFYIIDNGSTDGTKEYLLRTEDCHVFYTEESFKDSNHGVDWLNPLLQKYGTDHWVTVIDADELLVYPGCEEHSLKELAEKLELKNKTALQTFLLDMYSDRPINETKYIAGKAFLDTCQFFDPTGYSYSNIYKWLKFIPYLGYRIAQNLGKTLPKRGGPRARVFWANHKSLGTPPFLQKTPFLKWKKNNRLKSSTHVIEGISRDALAKITGALLHFKFFSDFSDTAIREASLGNHYADGSEYKTYANLMQENPKLSLYCKDSTRYVNSAQLVKLKLLNSQKNFWK